jgi:hypothetical protein
MHPYYQVVRLSKEMIALTKAAIAMQNLLVILG